MTHIKTQPIHSVYKNHFEIIYQTNFKNRGTRFAVLLV